MFGASKSLISNVHEIFLNFIQPPKIFDFCGPKTLGFEDLQNFFKNFVVRKIGNFPHLHTFEDNFIVNGINYLLKIIIRIQQNELKENPVNINPVYFNNLSQFNMISNR